MTEPMERRAFLKASAAVGVTALAGPALAAETAPVYVAHDDSMTVSTDEGVGNGNGPIVEAALNSLVKHMTGQSDLGLAWQAVFGMANDDTDKTIAIKINCLRSDCSPQLATLDALVRGLTAMCGGSFPAGNIRLFDNDLWSSEKIAAAYGATALNAMGAQYTDPSPMFDDSKTVSITGTTMYAHTYLSDADYLISFAPLKRHQIASYSGGSTAAIKNMMGAFSTNASRYAGGSTFHDGGGSASSYVDLFSDPWFSGKLKLCLIDMMFATNHAEGPWVANPKKLCIAKDPCATDAYCSDQLDALAETSGGRNIPEKVAAATSWTDDYNEVIVDIDSTVTPPTRAELEDVVRDHRDGTVDDDEVKAKVKAYREQ